jgi:hypothetical protein
MGGDLRRDNLGAVGNSILAAVVRLRSLATLSLKATIHCLAILRDAGEAIERPDQHHNCQQANESVNAALHSILQYTSFVFGAAGSSAARPNNPFVST